MEEMIRKQVSIEPRQERLLKERARSYRVTEADLIRQAIDRGLLVDANVFVYTYVTAEPEKRARALDALDRLVLHGRGKISTQVLGLCCPSRP